MKKLFLTLTVAGLLAACNSNKKSSGTANYTSTPVAKTNSTSKNTANTVSPVNEPEKATTPMTHLDSLLMHSKTEESRSSYNSGNTYHNGASGVGTGSSYAGHAYAKLRYKKKPKYTKNAVPPMEQELTDNVQVIDSSNAVTPDSSSVNQGW
ncbi:MAG: hypothetical protein ACJ75J_16150 [Cytophagaceae bacterium]